MAGMDARRSDNEAAPRATQGGAAQVAEVAPRPAATDERERAVLAERLRILGRNNPPILFVHLVLAGIMWVANRPAASPWLSDAWLLAMGVMVAARLALHRRAPAATAVELRRQARGFVLGSGAAGVLWGSTALLYFWQGALEQQFLLVVALTGMGAGAVTSLIMYMPAFYAYLLPSLMPLAGVSLFYGDMPHAALGIATLVYALALGYFGRNFSRALVESLMLRYENLDLVGELRAQKQQADEANAAKSRFLAAASHDLRQPVHALALFNGTLQTRAVDDQTAHVVAQMGAAVETLERMFDGLLDISRLDAGVLEVRAEACDLAAISAELVAEFTPLAAEKGLVMSAQDMQGWVWADRALLERILRNLLTNAVRYTDSGTVCLRCREAASMLRIEVADSGPGIAAADQTAIFQEFHQLEDTRSHRRQGLGLGLAIVARAARLLGTRTEVHSSPGMGSVFSIALPRTQPVRRADTGRETAPVAPVGDDLDRLEVLVVDDNAGILKGMQTLLGDWHCAPTCCESHAAVLALLDEGYRPQAVIADFRLAGEHTGYDTILAVRAALGQPVPAIIITGDIVSARLREAQADGIPVLHKPAAPAKLRSFLRSARRLGASH